MYIKPKYSQTSIVMPLRIEGETIEQKVERIVNNKEPIKDGAPEIFTERGEGVIAAYNIRTDRFEIAADAMDRVSASVEAKRAEKAKAKEAVIIDINKTESKTGEGEA